MTPFHPIWVALLMWPLALIRGRPTGRRAMLVVVGAFFLVNAMLDPERLYSSLFFALLAFAL